MDTLRADKVKRTEQIPVSTVHCYFHPGLHGVSVCIYMSGQHLKHAVTAGLSDEGVVGPLASNTLSFSLLFLVLVTTRSSA